jgi:hypothetical protein
VDSNFRFCARYASLIWGFPRLSASDCSRSAEEPHLAEARRFETPVLEDNRANSQAPGNGCAPAHRSNGRVQEPEVRIHLPPARSQLRTRFAINPAAGDMPRTQRDWVSSAVACSAHSGWSQCLARRLSAHNHVPRRLRPFAACHSRGTKCSNPAPSCGESPANLTSSIVVGGPRCVHPRLH